MSADDARLEKVRRYSASLRRLFGFFLILTVLTILVDSLLMVSGKQPFIVRIGPSRYSGESLTAVARAIAFAQLLLTGAIVLKLNFHLMKLFGLYARAKIFSAENVAEIRQIGIALLLFPALWALSTFVPLLVPIGAPSEALTPRPFLWLGSFSAMPFTQIIVGTIVLVVSWIMDVGRELREEHDLVV